jgi:hypothetical protein
MTTKTLSSLIIAGVLVGSAAAAVQAIDRPSISAPGSSVGLSSAQPAASDRALFLLLRNTDQSNAIPAGLKQRPAGIVRIAP